MDTAQWPQGIGLVKPMEELIPAVNSNNNNNNNNNSNTRTTGTGPAAAASQVMVERKTRPQKEQALNCPRCNSTNTKFCYYNNYSLTQPRYFCKTCRRYWTEGGSLRNVPVGGGSRKNKRTSSCTSSTTSTTTATAATTITATLPSIRGQDLNLAFPNPRSTNMGEFGEMASIDQSSSNNNGGTNQTSCSSSSSLSAMELLRSGMAVRGLSPFVSMPDAGLVPYPAAGFGLHHDFKTPPSLSFNINPHDHQVQENAGRLLFPFEDLRQVDEGNRGGHGGDAQAFWSGMMGGGGGASGPGSW